MNAQPGVIEFSDPGIARGATRATGCSVLIIAYNEEACIEACLDSVRWSDDIVVIDSFSTDGTMDILARYPSVRVIQRAFDDFSSQRNFGLHQSGLRNGWVLIIDADESCPEALQREIRDAIVTAPAEVSAFWMLQIASAAFEPPAKRDRLQSLRGLAPSRFKSSRVHPRWPGKRSAAALRRLQL